MNFVPATMAVATMFAAGLPYAALNVADADTSGPHPPPLPLIRSSAHIEYPRAAAKLGREGRVLLAFAISERGLATNASVIFADDDSFDPAAIELLTGLRFSLPANWEESGGRYKRFQLGVVFCIPPSAQSEVFADVTAPIFIMTSRTPGSPELNPLPAAAGKAAGSCATHAKI